ncbi:MAG: AIR synthase-related protein [Candidatus Eiseniibacteriota bacterium]
MNAVHTAPLAYDEADFRDPDRRGALRERLAPFGIRLDAYELGLLVERLGRAPRWAELVIMNTMWSEHCSYKSTRHLLSQLPTSAPQVVLGPGEDAGAVFLGEHAGRRWLAVVAHESHNHPSQIVPYEGAATGVGGIVRDVYCMGADVVGVLDALRMGTGTRGGGLKAREILDGVVSGIGDYGNALGVPNLGGDLEFHPGYDANVLVNVVAVGVVEETGLIHSRVPAAGDFAFVLVGKPTDRSGFGGASFSSGVLGGESDQRGAVQLPDPFLKRVLAVANQAVLERARERRWAIGFKDLGAGGIACVTSELADHGGVGAEIRLDHAHRVPDPLPPEVLLCAETQERFCWVVPWEAGEEVAAIYNDRFRLDDIYPGAGASVIGRTRADGAYRVLWGDEVIVECPVSFLTSGVRRERASKRRGTNVAPRAERRASGARNPGIDPIAELAAALVSPALCSRAPLYRRYDPEVKGHTVVRAGEADAGVLLPVPGARFGFAMAVDGNPRLCQADPGAGASHAVWEAARNVAATGAWPWCLTDCLNYGRPEDPGVMGDLEAGIEGLREAALALGTLPDLGADEPIERWAERVRGPIPALPFVSGNVSLYNEDEEGGAIPPSPIVACLGRVPDVARVSTPGLKNAGNALLLVGRADRGRLRGSLYAARHPEESFEELPAFEPAEARAGIALVLALHARGLVRACHDVGDGGVAQALAEMSFGASARVGFEARLPDPAVPGIDPGLVWFSEEPGFVVELAPVDLATAETWARALGVETHRLGRVRADDRFVFEGPGPRATEASGKALLGPWSEALHLAFEVSEEVLA